METETLQARLEALAGDRVRVREPMRLHTTFRIGGPADLYFAPATTEEIACALRWAGECAVPVFRLGNGSNLLVSDEGIEGLVLHIGEHFGQVEIHGTEIRAQSGASLAKVCRAAGQAGLSGLEFAYGIPGTVGGAIMMNAGAYGGEISHHLVEVEALDEEAELHTVPAEDMRFSYRHSLMMEVPWTVTGAVWRLAPGDPKAIMEVMRDYTHKRAQKQPLQLPSAGSVFKRPEGHYAGALIEAAGLKGLTVGGAQVSTLHAGFIVNVGDATAEDVMRLADLVTERVYAHSGVLLEKELRITGRTRKG